MNRAIVGVFLTFLVLNIVDSLPDEPHLTYDRLYNAAVDAYVNERWFECATHMKRALEDYKYFTENLSDCRQLCKHHNIFDVKSPAFAELHYFENALQRSDCIRRCKKKRFGDRPETESVIEVRLEFDSLKPYDYLQICAFKSDNMETAVGAAYTYLLYHPNHEVMKKNVEYYRTMDDIPDSYFVNMHIKYYQIVYGKGAEAYNSEDWEGTIRHMEDALVEYIEEFERCQLLCEGRYDHEAFPELYNSIADHFISTLHCKEACPKKLDYVAGEFKDDYLAEHYNYLQFAYYKGNNLQKSCEAVASYLLLHPEDETMLTNKNFYLQQAGISEEDFKPRKEAFEFQHKQKMLERMIKFVQNEYTFSDADVDMGLGEEFKDDGGETEKKGKLMPPGGKSGNTRATQATQAVNPVPDDESDFRREPKPKFIRLPEDRSYQRRMELYGEKGVVVSMEAEDLQGDDRVVVEGILSEEECQNLIEVASLGASQGDGYQHSKQRPSPHTDYEKFEGLTIIRAAEEVVEGTLTSKQADLYLDASEKVRQFLNDYLNLKFPLYYHYTHLVCRTALEEQETRDDLSHPVHADNCYIQTDGSCLKKRPAYINRDYSALLYLNDDFEGGDFFFAHRNLSVQQKVRPKCGRAVGFDAGDYHGVQAVTGGKRCALAAWYTLDPIDQELSHAQAKTIIHTHQFKNRKRKLHKELKQLVKKDEIDLIMREEELNGPMRFAADNMATQGECEELIKLANELGQVGDGYQGSGLQSPHTKNEKFVGVTVAKVAQDMGRQSEGYQSAAGKSSPHTVHERYVGLVPLQVAELGGIRGDGYKGANGDQSASPHTIFEMFEGLNVDRAAQLAKENKVTKRAAQLFLDMSEKGRHLVETYFGLKDPLYFDYTHLVCRTALDASKSVRQDFSHPIHSDNCIMQEDYSCKKVRPAYTQRDFSALMYLNGDFNGGEFFFADGKLTVESTVKPTCGRMVGFNATNYHGVKAVLSGQRCAVALWFTLDKDFKEVAHDDARSILSSMPDTSRSSGEL